MLLPGVKFTLSVEKGRKWETTTWHFPEGIKGPELMELFKKQSLRFGTVIHTADVDEVDLTKRPFRVVSEGQEHFAESLIIATGAQAKWIGLESETALGHEGRSRSIVANVDSEAAVGAKLEHLGRNPCRPQGFQRLVVAAEDEVELREQWRQRFPILGAKAVEALPVDAELLAA